MVATVDGLGWKTRRLGFRRAPRPCRSRSDRQEGRRRVVLAARSRLDGGRRRTHQSLTRQVDVDGRRPARKAQGTRANVEPGGVPERTEARPRQGGRRGSWKESRRPSTRARGRPVEARTRLHGVQTVDVVRRTSTVRESANQGATAGLGFKGVDGRLICQSLNQGAEPKRAHVSVGTH